MLAASHHCAFWCTTRTHIAVLPRARATARDSYHKLHPEYVHSRLRDMGRGYKVRVLLVLIDMRDCDDALRELSRVAVAKGLSLLIASSEKEGALSSRSTRLLSFARCRMRDIHAHTHTHTHALTHARTHKTARANATHREHTFSCTRVIPINTMPPPCDRTTRTPHDINTMPPPCDRTTRTPHDNSSSIPCHRRVTARHAPLPCDRTTRTLTITAGRYIETFKLYENKPPDALQGGKPEDYLSRLRGALTTVKSVNKTDTVGTHRQTDRHTHTHTHSLLAFIHTPAFD
jgi:hypothetical protein